jgi:hypothetical protein
MREQTLIKAMEMHDSHINALNAEFKAMQKVLDKTYVQSLTHVMMWDCLMTLLDKYGMITRDQFETALTELSKKTQAAMEEEQKKKVVAGGIPREGRVTVPYDQREIPVIK